MSMHTPRIRLSTVEYEAVMAAREEGLELDRLVSQGTQRNLKDEITKNGNGRSLELVSSIRTIEDALRYAEVDQSIWEVERSVVNKWDMGFKDEKKVARTRGLWQVKVWLKRRAPKHLTDALEALHKRAEKYSPDYGKAVSTPRRVLSDPHLLELSLYDMHFGKLAWAVEGSTNYDLKIAERLFHNAICDLLKYVERVPVERVVFPVGNDFLHIDNKALTTEAGTEQGPQTDGRYAKIVETGFMALVKALDKLSEDTPVDVIFVAGNHDATSTYHIVRELRAWYRRHPNVNVDASPRSRKYYEYGATLLGYTHGHSETLTRLLNLMPLEKPEAWARTKCREWHTGHLHKRRVVKTTPVDSHEGTVVRTLPSLSGTDDWHYKKGFIGVRAAEAYLYHRDRGYVGHFAADARE